MYEEGRERKWRGETKRKRREGRCHPSVIQSRMNIEIDGKRSKRTELVHGGLNVLFKEKSYDIRY